MRFRDNRRQYGATVVEMAIITPVFLLILLSLIELSFAFVGNLSMQYAVREGARYAITGQNSSGADGKTKQRYEAIIESIRYNSMGFYDKLKPKISVNGVLYEDKDYSNSMFGVAGEIIVLRLDADWPIATPILAQFFTDNKYHFTVAATMRNEYFDDDKK